MDWEYHPNEEAGLCHHSQKNDNNQVSNSFFFFFSCLLVIQSEKCASFNCALQCFGRGTVHQSFPDFTFLTGNWIGRLMKLKGEIDPHIALDLSNKATLAFLQRHLSELFTFFSMNGSVCFSSFYSLEGQ